VPSIAAGIVIEMTRLFSCFSASGPEPKEKATKTHLWQLNHHHQQQQHHHRQWKRREQGPEPTAASAGDHGYPAATILFFSRNEQKSNKFLPKFFLFPLHSDEGKITIQNDRL
jgi:hypothetical protein